MVWGEVTISLIMDKHGHPIYFLPIIQDITERKQADQALRKNEDKFRNLFDNALEGVYQTTPEGRLISVNMAFSKMFGYESPEEMPSMTVMDLGSPDVRKPGRQEDSCRHFQGNGTALKTLNAGCAGKTAASSGHVMMADSPRPRDGIPCFQGFIIDITDAASRRRRNCF